jgi:CheY-like chemotaxis protein
VKSHGGFVTVTSRLAEGSSFHVFLPRSLINDATAILLADPALPRGAGETVLVIDDEAAIRLLVGRMLEHLNYKVVLAGDGLEGLRKFREHRETIRLVVIDLMMPVMGGTAAIRELRAASPELKVVAMSGMVPDEERQSLARLGIDEILIKPFTPEDLLAAVTKALVGG